MPPEVSVVMPAYNVPHNWLAESIESILNQTLADFEFIIIDDGSTNGLFEFCRGYADRDSRIRLFHMEVNKGAINATNFGVMQAKAPLIARQDADDISLADRLEKQVQYLKDNPAVVLSGLQMQMLFETNVPEAMRRHSLQYLSWYNSCVGDRLDQFFLKNICLASGTFMFHRDKFIAAGMYKQESRFIEEELVLRIKKYGLVAKVEEPLYVYRIHNQSTYSLHSSRVDQRMSEIRHLILKDILEPGAKVAVWGTGKGGREFLCTYLQESNRTFEVTMVVDGSGELVGQKLMGYDVQPKHVLHERTVDKILIAVSTKKALIEIKRDIKAMGYSEDDFLELYHEMD
ncbi:MAG TPA: glycosyltransferase family 2 protein [Paenibacillus sp.]|uniref:glycosyltransferase family 2 protein n=1 Tax=Paenibacillus sp. TaxID=58172 RepID=UPI002D0D761D|nr:glycosyltransferase family 2 protein [Paenibacillus sp.]HUC92012.1 glycosyltransferase family 2 protein [Paenibacillus sp.]